MATHPSSDPNPLDQLFQQAVAAIDGGDVHTLERLLAAHPELVSERLEHPGAWLRDKVGDALDGFFNKPYLLWFVAEDPVRNGRLSPTIVDVIRVIVDAARRQKVPTFQEQLDRALGLVAWSGVAADCGVQLEMIDALVDAGASPAGNANNALVNGHVAAAERLLERGGTLTFAAALCLERWDDVARLAPETNDGAKRFAFVLAALNGKAKALEWMIRQGIDVNQPSADLYSHGTPLHHAVCSGSLAAVKVLVNAGADVHAVDTAWHGTPLGWAQYYEEGAPPDRKTPFSEIVAFLEKY
jgi:hypothetical protein